MARKAMQQTGGVLLYPNVFKSLPFLNWCLNLFIQTRIVIGRRRYEILVVSFLVLIFGDTFSDRMLLAVLLPLQNMFVALLIYYDSKPVRNIVSCLIILSIIVALINRYDYSKQGTGILCVIYFLYFLLISFKVYQKIFTTRAVSSEMMAAVLCGFILLCLTGAILFITIEVNYPHSYANVASGISRFQNLSYFSFTTLLTIGYGDITPITLLAKRAVMLVGLAGHIYTVFLTGIIIGKYIQAKP